MQELKIQTLGALATDAVTLMTVVLDGTGSCEAHKPAPFGAGLPDLPRSTQAGLDDVIF